MRKFKKALRSLSSHGRVLFKGMVRTVCGALVAGMVGLAVFGFIQITKESGYNAVFDFVGAGSLVAIAVCCMYLMGGRKKGGFEK